MMGETINKFLSLSSEAFEKSLVDLGQKLTALGAETIIALVVLVVGFAVARLVGRLSTQLADRIGLQRAAENGGVVHSMRQVGIQRTVPQVVGTIMFWLVMFVSVMTVCNVLHLDAATNAMSEVVGYIPKILVATIIVVVGLLLASLMRGVIATGTDRLGLTYAPQLANAAYYLLAMMVMIAAFDQLDVQFALLNQAILIVFGGLALGFGLAFGLGGRDVVGGILAGYYVRQRLQTGDHVVVGDYEGRVREVGPVATVIESDENGLLHRRSIPNTRMLNEAVR